MRAMILAAGRGTRMRPLTDHTHKALLEVLGKPLIEHHILNLTSIGVKEIVINVSYLADQIQNYLGDGSKHNVNITYSIEEQALEVGGGIIKALPLLGDEPFIVVNCDVWTDYPFKHLTSDLRQDLAKIVLVENPSHNLNGDFYLNGARVEIPEDKKSCYTFSGLAVYHPKLFDNFPKNKIQPMLPILTHAIQKGCISGELYHGLWKDVGTPTRLEEAKFIKI